MTNNDVLKRIRYLFDYKDQEVISLFGLANLDVSKKDVIEWMKKDDDPLFKEISDKELATFLNGLIVEKRGKKDGVSTINEDSLTNNIILRKLKIALDLKTDDILDLFALTDKKISKHELSAFFRSPEHRSYRPFLDQYLRNFLNALQTKNQNNL